MEADSGGERRMERPPVEGVKADDMQPAERPDAPGGVYLCQVGERVSCGACCGLYNLADASRENLEFLLARRTEAFSLLPRDPDAITEFQVRMERGDPRPRPFPDFYHCPFLGFIGPKRLTVGCLLHPLAAGNGGVDYRGLSFYGGLACRSYFCPTYRGLPAEAKRIVKELAGDWYRYGLIVTEERLLRGFFAAAERRLGRPLTRADLAAHPGARQAVAEFLELKLTWPFRGPGWKGPGHYFFNDGGHLRPEIDYAAAGGTPSAFDLLLRELGGFFRSAAELRAAEEMIERLIARATAVEPRAAAVL